MNVLVFELENDRYAVLGGAVVEMVRAVAIAPISGVPLGIEGVFSLRGEIVPVVDVRARFRLPIKPLHPSQHFIVVTIGDRKVALRVDNVISFDHLEVDQLDTLMLSGIPNSKDLAGVATLDDGLVVIYDVEAFLSATEAEAIGRLIDAMPAPSLTPEAIA